MPEFGKRQAALPRVVLRVGAGSIRALSGSMCPMHLHKLASADCRLELLRCKPLMH